MSRNILARFYVRQPINTTNRHMRPVIDTVCIISYKFITVSTTSVDLIPVPM